MVVREYLDYDPDQQEKVRMAGLTSEETSNEEMATTA